MHIRWRLAQFFEIYWWRRYLRRLDKTAYLDWKRAYWRRLLDRFGLAPPAGSAVLDAGCGPAGVFMALSDCHTDATDPLIAAYERELPHFSRAAYPQVRFWALPMEQFFPGRQYDCIFCFNALNHAADITACLARLFDLARPGSRLVVSTDAHRSRGLRCLFRLLPGDVLHPQQWTAAEYESHLLAAGFLLKTNTVLQKGRIFDYILLVAERPGEPDAPATTIPLA